MHCVPEVYNEKGSVWARILSTDEKYNEKSVKTNNKWPQVGYVACDQGSYRNMKTKFQDFFQFSRTQFH